ncbi:hypothetical protein AT15_08560 [Kosmotoga arenicorallina S304]|uniref:Diguanylate cyclase n=1 Tax=Kosmotoga arenicorallina S304 TaxID=1453497 RepID=A0A176K1J9_9BACT|nr:hypothetical protein AT15_08560 [Kosmotoga arenicorallina S304]
MVKNKVLVVDDSTMWRNTLKTALEKAGFTVETAVDGIDALNRFFHFLPDVLVTDYLMPRMNAIQLTQLIRSYSSFQNVGILILTGTSDFVNEFWAKKSGANLFLKKSSNLKGLIERIMEFAAKSTFHSGWHRDIYKTHEIPFGELSDILEEKLKIEAINRELLSLLKNIEDEDRVIAYTTDLIKDFVNFKSILWLLISPVGGRIYSLPKIGNSTDELKKLLIGRLLKPLTPSRWHYSGISSKLEPIEFDQALSFPLKVNGEENGLVLIEGAENKSSLEGFMDYALESLSLLASTLNNFWEQKTASTIDFLTSLFNRRSGIMKIKELLMLHERTKIPFTIGMLDIDDFKSVNDTYGHNVGDEALREFGKAVSDSLRETDMACRYGGEEFLVVFPGAGINEARRIVERLKENFAKIDWNKLLSLNLQITFSTGLAAVKEGMGLYDIIEKADKALYMAKSSGKNCIKIEE